MAERFARGGRLIALGRTPAARSDARHVAVEFVHPVIVGKRALPAIGLAGEDGDLPRGSSCSPSPDDIAIAFGAGTTARGGSRARRARARGCLTMAFAPPAPSGSSCRRATTRSSRQELAETLYHVLWELVHVFFDHRGLLAGRDARPCHDAGASSFLYPFLDEREDDLEAVVDDVRRSVLMKAAEVGGAARADARPRAATTWSPPRRRCAAASTRAARCSRSATAARRPTRWTRSPTSDARRSGWPRGRRST